MRVIEAAEMAGVSRQVISAQCKNGTILATKEGRRYEISPSALKAFMKLKRKPWRHRKKRSYTYMSQCLRKTGWISRMEKWSGPGGFDLDIQEAYESLLTNQKN